MAIRQLLRDYDSEDVNEERSKLQANGGSEQPPSLIRPEFSPREPTMALVDHGCDPHTLFDTLHSLSLSPPFRRVSFPACACNTVIVPPLYLTRYPPFRLSPMANNVARVPDMSLQIGVTNQHRQPDGVPFKPSVPPTTIPTGTRPGSQSSASSGQVSTRSRKFPNRPLVASQLP